MYAEQPCRQSTTELQTTASSQVKLLQVGEGGDALRQAEQCTTAPKVQLLQQGQSGDTVWQSFPLAVMTAATSQLKNNSVSRS